MIHEFESHCGSGASKAGDAIASSRDCPAAMREPAPIREPDPIRRLWQDDTGFIVSIELILIVTILVIGLIAGLTALRDAVVSELTDVARSLQETNQSFSANGVTGGSATTAGSAFVDASDSSGTLNGTDQCIVVFGTADES